ncbi:MAG: hypothetical protein CK530_03535 [Planctomycetaceae bacterium]|nr:MAG: hypothetical protein CK530_03535 [Planctomycetaceae bacterium]
MSETYPPALFAQQNNRSDELRNFSIGLLGGARRTNRTSRTTGFLSRPVQPHLLFGIPCGAATSPKLFAHSADKQSDYF